MSRRLKPELVTALQLEQYEAIHPETVLMALETAQEELCLDTGFEPGDVFSIENKILQCYHLPSQIINVNNDQSLRAVHSLLHYTASTRLADRITQFNCQTGHNIVSTETFENCNITIDGLSIPCFSVATLYLYDQGLLSVFFARII